MKFGLLPAIILGCVATLQAANPGTYNYEFASESHLAKGKWVKITIGESGMYELSYDQLRQMGFSDPTKVAVYGVGGNMPSINFTNYLGNRVYEDNPKAVACAHTNDKLIFYGCSAHDVTVDLYATSFYYNRPQNNIYTLRGTYLLTDSRPAMELPVKSVSDKSKARLVDYGYDYLFHERDLKFKVTGGGQQYWGENLVLPGHQSFGGKAKYVYFKEDPNYAGFNYNEVRGSLLMDIYIRKDQPKATVDIRAEGTTASYALNDRDSGKYSFRNSRLSVPASGDVNFTIDCSSPGNTSNFAYLDYWAVTYPKTLTLACGDPDFVSERFGFLLGRNEVGRFVVPEGSMVWDVTTGTATASLEVEDGYAYTEGWQSHVAMVFNPERELLHPDAFYSPISVSNLHALQNEPYDFAIITVPAMLPQAEKIAELHRKHDGYRVVVVTQEELFNEFNAGSPDPIAYRAFLKMLYQNSEGRFKNALFIGPLYADFRNIVANGAARPEGLISLQHPAVELDDNPGKPALDFYGCMSDYVTNTTKLQEAPMEIGIGFLPVKTTQEAELAVSKIKEYLETEDFSWVVNESMGISCEGDSHAHDNQITTMDYIIQDIMNKHHNSKFVNSVIWLEGVGKEAGRSAISEGFNRGKLLTVYYGHAGWNNIADLYTTNDLVGLKNPTLGFMFMAGCDLAMPDLGANGFGTASVLTARRGMVGSIFGTRSVLSNFNQSLCEAFVNGLFQNSDKTPRTESPTVGEAYAYAKDYVANVSESAYILCGDPALKVPVALSSVRLSAPDGNYAPGSVIPVSGEVLTADGKVDKNYNGYASIKLMAPAQKIVIDSSTSANGKPKYPAAYADMRLSAVKVKVNSGKFEAKLPVTSEAAGYVATDGTPVEMQIFAGTYNPSNRLGASGYKTLNFTLNASEQPETDTEAPTVAISYNPDLNILNVSAADNVALTPGIGAGCGIRLTVDGEEIRLSDPMSLLSGVSDYDATVAMARWDVGEHTAVVVASDLHGNTSEARTLKFNISNPQPLKLNALSVVAVDRLDFSLSQAIEGMELIVEDFNGNVIARSDASSREFSCDLEGVKAGTYRAAVRHNSARGANLYSNWVTFSVID